MADYNWNKYCCGAGPTSPHELFCEENPAYAANVRKRDEVLKRKDQDFEILTWPSLWACMRCGVVIYDPDLHLAFVAEYPDAFHPAPKAVTPERCKVCGAYIYEDQPHGHTST